MRPNLLYWYCAPPVEGLRALQFLDQYVEMQWIGGGAEKAEMLIECLGGIVFGMHDEGTDTGNVRCLEGAAHRILEQPRTDSLALPAGVNGFRYSLIDREAFRAIRSFGGIVNDLNPQEVSGIPKAAANVREYAAEIIEKLKAGQSGKRKATHV